MGLWHVLNVDLRATLLAVQVQGKRHLERNQSRLIWQQWPLPPFGICLLVFVARRSWFFFQFLWSRCVVAIWGLVKALGGGRMSPPMLLSTRPHYDGSFGGIGSPHHRSAFVRHVRWIAICVATLTLGAIAWMSRQPSFASLATPTGQRIARAPSRMVSMDWRQTSQFRGKGLIGHPHERTVGCNAPALCAQKGSGMAEMDEDSGVRTPKQKRRVPTKKKIAYVRAVRSNIAAKCKNASNGGSVVVGRKGATTRKKVGTGSIIAWELSEMARHWPSYRTPPQELEGLKREVSEVCTLVKVGASEFEPTHVSKTFNAFALLVSRDPLFRVEVLRTPSGFVAIEALTKRTLESGIITRLTGRDVSAILWSFAKMDIRNVVFLLRYGS